MEGRPSCEGRGLKRGLRARRIAGFRRPSCEGRGLKPFIRHVEQLPAMSPLMRGAWIETRRDATS